MDWLVFLVVRRRNEHGGKLVEGDLPVGLGIVDRLAFARLLDRLVIRLAVLQREGQSDPEIVHPHVDGAETDAEERAELRPERLHVAHALQVLVDRALLVSLRIGGQFVALASVLHRLEDRFRAHLAGQHGVVAALDARHVDETGRAADQRAAGEGELRHGLEAAFGDGARAIGDALAALESVGHGRVMLEALELVEGREVGILVVQVNHETDRHEVLAEVIEEGAAAGRIVERPAHRVLHKALLVLGRIDLPELLEADAELLRLAAFVELELADQFLRQRTAHAFREERVLAAQFHAGGIAVLVAAVLRHAHVAGDDAAHRAVLAVEHFRAREARIDFDAERLRLLREPAADIRKAHDVVAVIVHQRREKEIRNADAAGRAQIDEVIRRYFRIDRGALLAPVGNQRIEADRIDHGAGKDMRADFRAFFDQADRNVEILFRRELAQTDRRGKARRAAADDDDVIFHILAFDCRLAHIHPLLVRRLSRSSRRRTAARKPGSVMVRMPFRVNILGLSAGFASSCMSFSTRRASPANVERV